MQSHHSVTFYRTAIICGTQLNTSCAIGDCPTDQLLQPIMLMLLAQNKLQLQLNSTVNQKSIDFFFSSLQFSDIRNSVALFIIIFAIFTSTHKVYYRSHPRIQDCYHINNTEYGSKSSLYWIRYQQRTKDNPLPPRKGNRTKMCEMCLSKFK